MNRNRILSAILAVLIFIVGRTQSEAQYAAEAISYNAGATPSSGLGNASSALSSPERFTGDGGPFPFPSVVSPFSPPYLDNEIVSIGESGQLTLRLSHYAIPQAAGPEIGLFSNFGLIDVAYPNGQAGTPASGFGPPDNALVEVSESGATWVGLGSVTFDIPTNGYTDLGDPYSGVPGGALSDFQQPFTGILSSFDGKTYGDMLTLLAGSGGGKWIDISTSGLAQVGYVRLSLADDGFSGTSLNFELDAVSISHAAMGGPTVPEPATMALAAVAIATGATWRRRECRPFASAAESAPRPARPKARHFGSGNLHQKRTSC